MSILICVGMASGYSLAASLTGVILSDQKGEGPHASGEIKLLVGSETRTLYYGEPLPRDFRTKVCGEIGAIWSVDFIVLPDRTDSLVRVSCSGEVDPSVNNPWLLVRGYLSALHSGSTDSSTLFSSHWRSSTEAQDYLRELRYLDMTAYEWFCGGLRCIEVVEVDRPNSAHLRVSYLKLSGKFIYLIFDVAFDPHDHRWQIESIRIE